MTETFSTYQSEGRGKCLLQHQDQQGQSASIAENRTSIVVFQDKLF